MKRQKTTEGLMKEVVMIILLFIAIGLMVSMMIKIRQIDDNAPTIKDLHQQQEMIDYHRAQGRNIVLHQ